MRTLLDGIACVWLQAWRAIGDADMMLWLFCFKLIRYFAKLCTKYDNSFLHLAIRTLNTLFNQNLHTLTARCRTTLQLALGSILSEL